MVRSLDSLSDRELVQMLQLHPESGRYSVALYCRYRALLKELVRRFCPQPAERAHYLNRLWQQFYQTWLDADDTAPQWERLDVWITTQLPQVFPQLPAPKLPGSIEPDSRLARGSAAVSPPLWCYLQQAIASLPGDLRFILVFAEVFQWQPEQISAQLAAEGYALSLEQVQQAISRSRERLLQLLPSDILSLFF